MNDPIARPQRSGAGNAAGPSRIVVTIDEVVIDGIASEVPPPLLVRQALEREVRRLVIAQPISVWQAGVRDRITAHAEDLSPASPFGDVARAVATRIVSSASLGAADVGRGGKR